MTRLLLGLVERATGLLLLPAGERLLWRLPLLSRRRGGDGEIRRRRGGDGDGRPPPRSARAPRGGEPRRIGDRERPPRAGRFSRRRGEREREREESELFERELEPEELPEPEEEDPESELLDELLEEERARFLLSFSTIFSPSQKCLLSPQKTSKSSQK